jgi:hypothetical protein
MTADHIIGGVARRPGPWALLGAVALSLAASGALAQGLPPQEPLTPAQQLVQSAGPSPGGYYYVPPPSLPDAPMPGADPRDFQGTWFHNQGMEFRIARDMFGNSAPYTMKGAQIVVRRMKGDRAGKPYTNLSAKCRPPGPLMQLDLNMPFTVFQSKDGIRFVFEEFHGRWHIITNPDAVPAPAEKTYMGRSVGHWDGDTLVVETKDFKHDMWLDVEGTPLSANGKLTQRIRKVDNGDREPYLEIITTIDDPAYYTKRWSVVRSFGWTPNLAYHKEYNCEEQIGDRSVNADAGLMPEPKD